MSGTRTNADVLRSMSDEQMALSIVAWFFGCGDCEEDADQCVPCFLKWLGLPAEEGDAD